VKMVKYQFSFAAQWVLTLAGEGSGLELILLGKAPETCSNPAAPSTRWPKGEPIRYDSSPDHYGDVD